MEIPVAQPFGSDELTENLYHDSYRGIVSTNWPLGISQMFPPGRRGWLGSLQWLHHSPLHRRPLSWPSARRRAHGSGTSIHLDSSSPLRTASNRRCSRTALGFAFPGMICSTAFGAYISSQTVPWFQTSHWMANAATKEAHFHVEST